MMSSKWTPSDPDIGSPVFMGYSDPAMADLVVHFVGRQRGRQPVPTQVGHLTAEQRLVNILQMRQLYGFPVPRSQSIATVCLSDLSSAELEAAFARGLNSRGAVEPWAVVLHRVPTWELGFRPVVYADWARIEAHRKALVDMYGRGWNALAVPTELRRDMTREDWTSEREWRFCFPPGTAPAAIGIEHGVAAIIVGRSSWEPPYPVALPPAEMPPQRWLWDPTSRRLIHDGRVAVWSAP
jgi:hypothetical protein